MCPILIHSSIMSIIIPSIPKRRDGKSGGSRTDPHLDICLCHLPLHTMHGILHAHCCASRTRFSPTPALPTPACGSMAAWLPLPAGMAGALAAAVFSKSGIMPAGSNTCRMNSMPPTYLPRRCRWVVLVGRWWLGLPVSFRVVSVAGTFRRDENDHCLRVRLRFERSFPGCNCQLRRAWAASSSI